MNRMWLGAVLLVGLIGCGGSSRHEVDWAVNVPASVAVGSPDCVQYGAQIPDGAEVFFDITDVRYDDMDASVVSADAACDGSSGFGSIGSTSWYGTLSGNTGSLPAGTYDLAVSCYNSDGYPCQFTIASFGYSD